jgi:uncharacterized protein with GYD domain
MAKYIMQGDYTAEGSKGLVKEGASSRREAVAALVGSVGGSLESLNYRVGSSGYVVIASVPDRASMSAIAAAIVASGAVTVTDCFEILTPPEMDEALKKSPSYRPPGR